MYPVVFVSTLIVFVISFFLSALISLSYTRVKSSSQLLWSFGMWFFAACVLLESIFAFGAYSQFLIKLYLLLVAVLVEFLAMGSVVLLKRRIFSYLYAVYSIAATAYLIYALAVSGSLGNLIKGGVVSGSLPTAVTVGSVLITAVGATLLILLSIISFVKERNPRLLSIILGVLVLSAGGTLYIAAFPSVLYLSEFLGIVLIWFGVVDFSKVHLRRGVTMGKPGKARQ